jgi:hypothetical protein
MVCGSRREAAAIDANAAWIELDGNMAVDQGLIERMEYMVLVIDWPDGRSVEPWGENGPVKK